MVTDQDRAAMKNILSALDGNKTALKSTANPLRNDDDLIGPGQVSPKAIDAMAQVLKKFNNVTAQIVTESRIDPQLSEAIHTTKTNSGVKVGSYQIMIKEDPKRLAGKQYYGIYHTKSGDIIANDLTLYETALSVVKQLNNGKYVNSLIIRNLFDADNRYTAHRTDAIRFKLRIKEAEAHGDASKSEIYESRYQASVAAAMQSKRDIKRMVAESRINNKIKKII
jgi:hypothetical protein